LTSNVLALALPLALLQVYDRIVPNQAQGTAAVLFSVVLIALLADGFLRFVRFRTLAHIGARFEFASTERLIERLFGARLAELRDVGAGSLRAAITALSQSRELYTGQGLLPFFDAPFGVLFLLLVWYLGGSLVLVPLAILLLLGIAALWSGKRHRRSLTDLAAAERQRTGLISEAFAGL
jgi:ABC-type bacteriocin/lantibiotic exporter with double-glycine peptidase domain